VVDLHSGFEAVVVADVEFGGVGLGGSGTVVRGGGEVAFLVVMCVGVVNFVEVGLRLETELVDHAVPSPVLLLLIIEANFYLYSR
jgi:hypothetical protein